MKYVMDPVLTQTRKLQVSRDLKTNRVMLMINQRGFEGLSPVPVDMTFQEAQDLHRALGSVLENFR